jgi:hypothetical protein
MTTKEKAPNKGAEVIANSSTYPTCNLKTKQFAMLNLFVQKGGVGLNCFEAANFYHDYVLRTTVSDLQRKYGLIFLRKMESVPNAFGGKTDCKRYWLDELNIDKARKILKG